MPNEPKILIIEDDDISNMLYREILKKYKCHFDIVESAELALEKFDQEDYDLLFIDIRLPKMNGFDFARKIRLTQKGKYIPSIGISAITLSLVEEEFQSSGMNRYLSKPLMIPSMDHLLKSYNIHHR